mmetsp:Transcript_15807/g.20636  ORF Transcript_15807/g.20636 Transcript_15807/m.20636 type:complete len:198 (+) Transcript_15807:538-1131(+)
MGSSVDTPIALEPPAVDSPRSAAVKEGFYLVAAQHPQQHQSLPPRSTPPTSPSEDETDYSEGQLVLSCPPVAEVEIMDSQKLDASFQDEQRVGYLEERIENTENLVGRIYSDLNRSRHSMLEALTRKTELQEQLEDLHHEVEEKSDQSIIFSGWYFFVCIMLYAFGRQDLFIASIISFWLSMQSVNSRRVTLTSGRK